MTDTRWIVPPYHVTEVQTLCDKASRAIQDLAAALPYDHAGWIEMEKFLTSEFNQSRDYFREAPP